jgi:hypothetical protein
MGAGALILPIEEDGGSMWDRIRSGRPATVIVSSIAAFIVLSASASAARGDTLRQDGVRLAGSSLDAREVFFLSPDRLLPADRDDTGDLYEHSPKGLSLVATGKGQPGGAVGASFQYVTLDGKGVFFQTAKQLVESDTDSAIDLYERTPAGLTLISTGPQNSNGPEPARFQGASPDGTHVIFATAAALTPDDTDTALDL